MFKEFITRHFGGVPTFTLKDIAWILRVNPNWPKILPTASEFRAVAPGSGPEFVRPKNDKISKNQYYTRDVRRSFPQTVVYKSDEIAKFVTAPQSLSISSGAAGAAASTTGADKAKFTPPIINNKYQWKESLEHLVPDDINTDIRIKGRT